MSITEEQYDELASMVEKFNDKLSQVTHCYNSVWELKSQEDEYEQAYYKLRGHIEDNYNVTKGIIILEHDTPDKKDVFSVKYAGQTLKKQLRDLQYLRYAPTVSLSINTRKNEIKAIYLEIKHSHMIEQAINWKFKLIPNRK